jgi:hypothetical protein
MQNRRTVRERLVGQSLIGFDMKVMAPTAMVGKVELAVTATGGMVGSEQSLRAPAGMVGSEQTTRGPRAMVGEGSIEPDC